MVTLSVIAVEDGCIVAVAPTGERYRVPVDAALRARLLEPSPAGADRRLSPREIQANVRAGMTPQQVAALTGASVESIQRFVGPVLAELAYVVDSALRVRLPADTAGGPPRVFGAVMTERLAQLDATGVRWTSAKEAAGWIVAVGFAADGVQHSARWRFDPKRLQLEPANVEASTLSQEGTPAALTPRLRAIEPTTPVAVVPPAPITPLEQPAPKHEAPPSPDRSRFDSDAFRFPDTLTQPQQVAPPVPPVPQPVGAVRPEPAAPPRAPQGLRRVPDAPVAQPTTDQLAALARRRGQREPAVDTGSLPITRSLDVVDLDERPGDVFAPRSPAARPPAARAPEPVRYPVTPLRTTVERAEAPQRSTPTPTRPGTGDAFRRRRGWSDPSRPGADPGPTDQAPAEDDDTGVAPTVEPRGPSTTRPRRGRTSMPSWDEIVFGRDD